MKLGEVKERVRKGLSYLPPRFQSLMFRDKYELFVSSDSVSNVQNKHQNKLQGTDQVYL